MSNRDEVIGNSRRNLVLKTAGGIRILVGDKYYDLNFRDEKESESSKVEETYSKFIIADSIKPYESGKIDYPGDNKIIFTLDGNIYYTFDSSYNKYFDIINENDSDDLPYSVTSDGIVVFNNNNVVGNLNAQFLNGKTSDDFVEKNKVQKFNTLIFDTISSSDGKFYYKNGVFSFDPNQTTFQYLSLSSNLELNIETDSNFSILSNGYTVSIPSVLYSSKKINIYTIDDTLIDLGDFVVKALADTYYTFVCVPISSNNYK